VLHVQICAVACAFHSLHDFSSDIVHFISGGRPEGSKRNLNFQGATWHHLKHLQSKDFKHHGINHYSFNSTN
jgi:hypothetical protein